jgi:hypothetical protein
VEKVDLHHVVWDRFGDQESLDHGVDALSKGVKDFEAPGSDWRPVANIDIPNVGIHSGILKVVIKVSSLSIKSS